MGDMCATAHVWISEDSLGSQIPPSSMWVLGFQTQVARLA